MCKITEGVVAPAVLRRHRSPSPAGVVACLRVDHHIRGHGHAYSSAQRVPNFRQGRQPPVHPVLAVSTVINLYYPLVIVLYVISALWQGNLGHW